MLKASEAWLISGITSTESRKSLIIETGIAKLKPDANPPVFCLKTTKSGQPDHFTLIITYRAAAASVSDHGIHLDNRPSAQLIFLLH